MKATIDRAGRVVIPKPVRDELGLRGGEQLDVVVRDGRIEIEPSSAGMRLAERDGRAVIEADREMPALTLEDVRAILERLRR
jgi:AbrB family looped-hinge helix DNA binding protein